MLAKMTAEQIKEILQKKFEAVHVEVVDDSARHAGHAGAKNGGHFNVSVVSAKFKGKSRIDRHREINSALDLGKNPEIHALSIQAVTPEEWKK